MDAVLADRLERLLGRRPASARALSGGCIAEVRLVEMPDGSRLAVKVDGSEGGPARPAGRTARRAVPPSSSIEAAMLRYLAERSDLPVPSVVAEEPGLLVMEFVESGGGLGPDAQRDAADHLAALHAIRPDARDGRPDATGYGLAFDTLIGPLHQPNPWSDRWAAFFAEHRLLPMAREAHAHATLSASALSKCEALAGRLDRLIAEPAAPSLIHGDCWGGNVLARDGRIAAFIDPAIYYADREIELAFTTLFGTFGDDFFDRYAEHVPGWDREGFFRERRDLYNLYPLLVHTRLFGGGYAAQLEGILRRFA